LFQYFINKSDDFANTQIANGLYKPSELVEIKIPLRLPYIQSQKLYESISGQIELKGDHYNYVALKITSDTMFVRCVNNHEKNRLVNENAIALKYIGDMPVQKGNHAPHEKKSGIDNDYFYTLILYNPGMHGQSLKKSYTYIIPQKLNTFFATLAQPPEQGIFS